MKLDAMIAEEITNTLDERLAQYTTNLKKHHFSAAYRIKRFQTIRKASQGLKVSHRFTVKRVRYALLAVFLAIFLLTGFSIWYTIGRFTFNAHTDHSVTYLKEMKEDKTKIESIYGLQSDTGFTLIDRQSDDEDVFSTYQSGDTKITLCQMVNDDVHNLNTEYSSAEKIMINDCEGIFISENNGECLAAWIMDGYLFMLCGNIDKNKLIFLAQSTNPEKFVETP